MIERTELLKALNLMSGSWQYQNEKYDKLSRFIYQVKTADECISAAEKYGVDVNYALHRWYNFATSKKCEEIFVKFGAKKEEDEYHHSIDIYINKIAYDVKLTIYPHKLEQENVFLDLENAQDKDKLIRWLYEHQSQETRKHLKSRIFIVCAGTGTYEKQKLKCDFIKIEKGIKEYMDSLKCTMPNRVEISDGNEKVFVYSDIIVIK